MKKIRKLLCKIGIHSYQHKRIERFFPYKNQTFEDERIILQNGSKSITHYDECCYCHNVKNMEHIKLRSCSQLVHKFPKLHPIITDNTPLIITGNTIKFPKLAEITWKEEE